MGSDDLPYELIEVTEGRAVTGRAVRCVQSQQMFDVSTLATPTQAQIKAQVMAAYREVGAWLVANSPHSPSRHRTALRLIRRTVSDSYLVDDLERDMTWIATADLGQRIGFLRDQMIDAEKERLIDFGAEIAASSGELSESDAEFIERVGTGMGLPSEAVYDIVLAKLSQQSAA